MIPDAPPPRRAMGHAPLRRHDSVRRTTSLEWTWPEGEGGPILIVGCGRDIVTRRPDDPPEIIHENSLSLTVSPGKILLALDSQPAVPGLDALIGHHTVSGFRRALADHVDLAAIASLPLRALLDDVVGCNIISGWVWARRRPLEASHFRSEDHPMLGACIGFAPGASSLAPIQPIWPRVPVPPLAHPNDPAGFHPLQPDGGITMRRVRRIDVWHEGDLQIDSMFQDSGSNPEGRREAIHEYRLRATADAAAGTLRTIEADPYTLPHPDCVDAPAGLAGLIGEDLPKLRSAVLRQLRGPLGCTHLNDAARALAEATALARWLRHGQP